ncbi:hypothetical protein ABPG72_019786 [Tetrahymena utriculariae]
MNQENKYYQILQSLLQAAKEEDERISHTQFSQRLDNIMAEAMTIPFHYSKHFEDFIKQQVEILCRNQNSIQTLIGWRSLFEKLKQTNKILTSESAELLISTVDIIIDELQKFKKKMDAPKFNDYTENLNQSIKQIKLTQSMIQEQALIHNQQYQQYYQNNNQQIPTQAVYQSFQQQNQYQGIMQQGQIGQPASQYNQGNFAFQQSSQQFCNRQLISQPANQFNNMQINSYEGLNFQQCQENLNTQNPLNSLQIPASQEFQNNGYQNVLQQNYQNAFYNQNYQNNYFSSQQTNNSSNMFNGYQDQNSSIKEWGSLIFYEIPEKQAISKVRIQGLNETNQKLFHSMIKGISSNQYNPNIIIVNLDLILKDNDQIKLVQENSDQIDYEMYEIYKQRILEQKKKRDLITMLNYVLNVIYSSAVNKYSNQVVLKAYLFGSFLQGTCLQDDSDIDVIIQFENINISYRSSLYFIQSVLKTKLEDEFDFQSVINKNVRIPFINITNKQTGYKIDIIYDNKLGILNSHLFHTYLNIHIKIKVLSVLFKIWAKNFNIKHQFKLTSYALLNIVIFYLIYNNYIKSLQDCNYFQFKPKFETINTYCKLQKVQLEIYTSFEKDRQKIINKLLQDNCYQKLEQTPLHKLFVDLVQFCRSILLTNQTFMYESQEKKIFITTRPFLEGIIGDLYKYKIEKNYISIQDPFENDYNPGQRRQFNYQEFNSALQSVPEQIANIQQIEYLFGERINS